MSCNKLMCDNCKKNPKYGGQCQRVDFGIPGISYTPDFQFNAKDTKRTSSGYHTWKGHSNYKVILEAPEGYFYSYFDISQLESRTIAYFSRDPNYQGAYTSGKDCYIEAVRAAHPDFTDKQLKEYRPYGKVTLISAWYGSSAESCATSHSLDLYECEAVMDGILDNWTVASNMKKHKNEYCVNTKGMIETFLGDRLDGDASSAYTISLNYANQNSASNLAVEGFETAVINAGKLGIEITPVSVIHDSCQCLNKAETVFENSLIYTRDFRGESLAKYGVDLKVSIVFMVDQSNDIEFSIKLKGKKEDYYWAPNEYKFTEAPYYDCTFEGPIECVDRLVDEIFKYRKTASQTGFFDLDENGQPIADENGITDHHGVEIVEDKRDEYPDEHFEEFLWETSARPHHWIDLDDFKYSGTRKVTLRVRDMDKTVEDHFKAPYYVPPMYMTPEQYNEYCTTGKQALANMWPETCAQDVAPGKSSGYYFNKVCSWDHHQYDPATKKYYCDNGTVFPAELFIEMQEKADQENA